LEGRKKFQEVEAIFSLGIGRFICRFDRVPLRRRAAPPPRRRSAWGPRPDYLRRRRNRPKCWQFQIFIS